jgi:hypothetical protein
MSGTTTPMMAQYLAMRKSLPADIILFYRLGDFYEMFFEDAQVAAPILNVALTKRHTTPMCGVPFHAAEGYLARLLKAGKRVAIAEQTSDPKPGKLVERGQLGVGGFRIEFPNVRQLVELPQTQIGNIAGERDMTAFLRADKIYILQTGLAVGEQTPVILTEEARSFLEEKIGDQRQH